MCDVSTFPGRTLPEAKNLSGRYSGENFQLSSPIKTATNLVPYDPFFFSHHDSLAGITRPRACGSSPTPPPELFSKPLSKRIHVCKTLETEIAFLVFFSSSLTLSFLIPQVCFFSKSPGILRVGGFFFWSLRCFSGAADSPSFLLILLKNPHRRGRSFFLFVPLLLSFSPFSAFFLPPR